MLLNYHPMMLFFSTLTNVKITEEQYPYCQEIWNSQNMQTMPDFVIWYNILDVVPVLSAVAKMFEFYEHRSMDMFKCAISVPGLSLCYLFLTLSDDTYFSLIDTKNKDLYYLIKKKIIGGPSIVSIRIMKKTKRS